MEEKQIISQIRNLKDEEIEKWIENRINYLEDNTKEDRETLSTYTVGLRRLAGEKENTEVHGYIPSKTRIKKMMQDVADFRLDDKELYKTIVEHIRNANEKLITNNLYIMHIIQHTIINYFGFYGTENRRNALYNSKDIEDDSLSIKDFKRNGTAMCVERAAVGQNILSFLGYDPMMIFGYTSNNKGITNEAHAYNCIIRENNAIIADFTNPQCKDGKYYRPSNFVISKEHLADFMKGKGQIEVQHKDYVTKGEKLEEELTSIVYASEEIDPKYFEKKKDTQELGRETTNEQKDTQEKNKIEQAIDQQQKTKEQTEKE